MDGSEWVPYQSAMSPTPSTPEYVSETSALSAAGASLLRAWTGGGDHFGYSVNVPAGSSKIEPGVVPAHPIVLKWDTFSDATRDAGMSALYAGISFHQSDLAGRELGREVAAKVSSKAQSYIEGGAKR